MASFAETVQLIAALSEMKDQKRRTNIQERQVTAAEKQAAAAERDQRYRRIDQALLSMQSSIPEVRLQALTVLKTNLGLSTEEETALREIAATAPIPLETIKTMTANKGFEQIQATPERWNASAIDAFTALTSGQNQGQVAGSQLGATLADMQRVAAGGLEPAMQRQLGLAGISRAVAGQLPGAVGVDAAMAADPKLQRFAAEVGAGTRMTTAQEASADIGRGGVQAQFAGVNASLINNASDFVARLASSKAASGGALTASDRQLGYVRLNEMLETIGNPKLSEAIRTQATAQYNGLAAIVDPRLMIGSTEDVIKDPGLVERTRNKMRPPGIPLPAPQGMYTNPLGPLVPPVTTQPWWQQR